MVGETQELRRVGRLGRRRSLQTMKMPDVQASVLTTKDGSCGVDHEGTLRMY